MKRVVLVLTVFVALLVPGPARCASAKSSAVLPGQRVKQVPVPYRAWFYNYPHALSPDYVFRTGRVFSPDRGGRDDPAPPSAPAVVNGRPRAEALREKVRELTRRLLENARENIAGEYVLTVSTFVNLNQLYATSSLGRYISEQCMTELMLRGVDVIDVRKTPGIMVHEAQGEYGLSRDLDELSYAQHATAMVVGTYTVADGQIFLNARLLRNRDGMVLSAASLVFATDGISSTLLADEGMPARPGSPVRLRGFDE